MESLLEGQTDSLILKKTRKSLSIEILKENLAWIYEKYSKIYGKKYAKEAFQHVIL